VVDLNALRLPDLFAHLTADGSLDRLLEAARREDLAMAGDVTTEAIVPPEATCLATGMSREAGVVAGLEALRPALRALGCGAELQPCARDGETCRSGQALWRLHGPLGPILTAERTILNIVGRLSGVATMTCRFVREVAGTRAVICDTRKTTPGLRALEKYAVRCGGGTLHRLGLHDAVLIKDNHLAGLDPRGVAEAVACAAQRARARHELRFVEVEVADLDQLRAIIALRPLPADIVLLDNMSLPDLRAAAAIRDAEAPGLLLEASGGISLASVRAVAEAGMDRISTGALTHSARWLDVALEIEP
jgi:nicotinate-nucleotide pyrophosphorylase (carboxylating)